MEAGRPTEAKDAVLRALAADPTSGAAHRVLAVCHLQTGDPEEAERAAREAVRHDPDDDRAFALVACGLWGRGKVDEAFLWLREASRIDPADPDHHALRAELHVAVSEWSRAEEAARAALAIDPDHLGAREALAAAMIETGRADEADDLARDSLRRDPGRASLHHLAGRAAQRLGDRTRASESFSTAARLAPEVAESRDEVTRSERFGRLAEWFRERQTAALVVAAILIGIARGAETGSREPLLPSGPVELAYVAALLVLTGVVDARATGGPRRRLIAGGALLVAGAAFGMVPGFSAPALIMVVAASACADAHREPPGALRRRLHGVSNAAAAVAVLALGLRFTPLDPAWLTLPFVVLWIASRMHHVGGDRGSG